MAKEKQGSIEYYETNEETYYDDNENNYDVYEDLSDTEIDKSMDVKNKNKVTAPDTVYDNVYESIAESNPQPAEASQMKCTKKQMLVLSIFSLILLVTGVVVFSLLNVGGDETTRITRSNDKQEETTHTLEGAMIKRRLQIIHQLKKRKE